MKRISLGIFCLVMLSSVPAAGQAGLPIREYTNPEELITLGRETTFDQAIFILNSFSRRFQDKIIIDRSGITGPIDINIPNMPWRQALDYIVGAKGAQLQEFPTFFEITAPVEAQVPVTPGTQTGQQQPIDDTEYPANISDREVEISAIFFEGNRRFLREIGVDWTTISDGIVEITNLGGSNVSQQVFTVNMLPQQIGDGFEINALLSTFEANNLGEILSTPKIRVVQGQEGRIQVGQDFSIKQRDFAGNVTDQFFSTGTILGVTPFVIHEGDTSFIYLEIMAERSSALPDPVSTIINKQTAQTRVLLYSGESTVIAGLYETEENRVRRGIPYLKDLPGWFFGLRYIFGYSSVDIVNKELVIILKAELVPSLRDRFNQPYNRPLNKLDEERLKIRETIGTDN